MNKCYLALGSNLKNPQRQLHQAVKRLRNSPLIHTIKIADFYFNEAVGRKSQPAFYNTIVAIRTRLNPSQLLNYCKSIEHKHGRVRKIRWGARTLDIDIIFYNKISLARPFLKIPHPNYQERDFVLIPLNQLLNSEHFFK